MSRQQNVPHILSPVQYSQIVAGSSTSIGPDLGEAQQSIAAVSTPANGTPATASPIPPSSAWTNAVTTTPSATPRIAREASSTTSSPRFPANRAPNLRTPEAAASPPEYITAAMMIVSRNWTTRSPMPPASAASQRRPCPT